MVFPGGYVQQTTEGCFTACLSMLTGIDRDLMPVVPPQMEWSYEGHPDEANGHVGWIEGTFDGWIAAMRDSGFELSISDIRPQSGDYIIATFQYGTIYSHRTAKSHAIAFNSEKGVVVDPIDLMEFDTEEYMTMTGSFPMAYITVTPL